MIKQGTIEEVDRKGPSIVIHNELDIVDIMDNGYNGPQWSHGLMLVDRKMDNLNGVVVVV